MSSLGVLHLIDTLEAGGAERVAVNLANHLPRQRYRPFLGTTRRDGPLATEVAADVGRLRLARRWRFDVQAVLRLAAFLRVEKIRLVHAHGSALFIAALATCLTPSVRLLWHVHYGRHADEDRRGGLYRLAARRAAGAVAVSPPLAAWCERLVGIDGRRCHYLPNFVATVPTAENSRPLPGTAGNRLLCVANLRPEKDQLTLLAAMAEIIARRPQAHLLLAGGIHTADYGRQIGEAIQGHALAAHVSLLGQRGDARALMKRCDIGVLSSISEGFPLVLLEYGLAGLPVVATRVGACPEVLADGEAGMLLPPSDPQALAAALLQLLDEPATRQHYGRALSQRVEAHYGQPQILARLDRIYTALLSRKPDDELASR